MLPEDDPFYTDCARRWLVGKSCIKLKVTVFKVSDIFTRFWQNLDFLDRFFKLPSTKCRRNPSSGSRTDMRSDGQTSTTKVISFFRDYANALNIELEIM